MWQSHREIIRTWPNGTKGFAEDTGMSVEQATSYAKRSSIPAYYWGDIERIAKRRKINGITHDVLKALSPLKRGKDRGKSASLHVA
jgi:hypothetical protein